ncbi:MAG: HEPN domain-containing protein [Syntrophales bacterium]|nr:HEPN domain-containing protein [Syntrophales bacterium]
MTSKALAEDYIKRAKIRFKVLEIFLKEKDYPDIIRISQEIVELIEKAILIQININPPKWHDVIDVIMENKDKLPDKIGEELKKIKKECKWLRSQREIAFYGAPDLIPTKDYSLKDAKKAISIASHFLELIEQMSHSISKK